MIKKSNELANKIRGNQRDPLSSILYPLKNIFRFHVFKAMYENIYVAQHSGKLLLKYLESRVDLNGKKILEIGSGPGYLFKQFKKKYKTFSYSAIDFAQAHVDEMNQQFASSKNFSKAYLVEEFPINNEIATNCFDVVLITEAITHLTNENVSMLLTFIRKVLSKDGKLIVVVPNETKQNVSYHQYPAGMCMSFQAVRIFDRKKLKGLLNEHGFDGVNIEELVVSPKVYPLSNNNYLVGIAG